MPPEDDDMSARIDIGKDINKLILDDNFIGHDFCGKIDRVPEEYVCNSFLKLTDLDKDYADNC